MNEAGEGVRIIRQHHYAHVDDYIDVECIGSFYHGEKNKRSALSENAIILSGRGKVARTSSSGQRLPLKRERYRKLKGSKGEQGFPLAPAAGCLASASGNSCHPERREGSPRAVTTLWLGDPSRDSG
jgi:hypothetical protein